MTDSTELKVAFTKAYTALNAAQKKAVDTIDGPVMVVAGPGTGKTQILTLRIANILMETDTAPDSILALTFTESGAKAMRERLRRYLGAQAYRVGIFTFHGFAQGLIGQYPDAYARIIGGRAATDIEKLAIVEELLEGGIAPVLRPPGQPTYYVTLLLRMISDLKQENVTPDRLANLIAEQAEELAAISQYHEKGAHKGKVRGEYKDLEKSIDKNRGLLAVYRAYQAALGEHRLYDFDDMIIETVTALEANNDMLRDLQERYQYILADEHQDVNGAQNRILELLASFHKEPNIFAVGDEKQAIYRFQGASLENFLFFTEAYPTTTVISLTDNYRSGQPILDVAHELVKVEEGPLTDLRIPLTAAAVPQAAITLREFDHQAVEDEWVVKVIEDELAAGTAASDLAVIVRTNKEVEHLAAVLRAASVPVTPSAEGDILAHPITQQVDALVRAVAEPGNEQALFTVLHGPYWHISSNDLMRVLKARSYEESLSTLVADEERLIACGVTDTNSVARVAEVLETARSLQTTQPPHQVLAYLLQESGLLSSLMTADPLESSRVVRRLYDEIESMVVQGEVTTLRDVVTQFQKRQYYNLPLNAPFITTDREAVQVMTAHKSKGLEFEVVIVPHLSDQRWSGGGKRRVFKIPLSLQKEATEHDVLEDERRLLYVALTRAKRRLLLSHAEVDATGNELVATRFLESLITDAVDRKGTAAQSAAFDPLASLQNVNTSCTVDATVITSFLAERGFSATSLNNYLRSPWDYLYRNVLRIPEPKTLPLMFGTAVHNVLETCTREHTKTGSLPNDTAVKKLLERELGKLPLTTEDFSQLLEKGLSALYPYLAFSAPGLPTTTREELKLTVMLKTDIPELPQLPLTGKLDRIDLNEEGEALRVIDYKTGKPKSRNVIEGKTKGSDGSYKRQLVFYALLLELHGDERYQTRTGVLSFVEPNSSGVIKEESFDVTSEEIAALRASIITAVGEITRGEFLQKLPTADDSEYWQLARLLMA